MNNLTLQNEEHRSVDSLLDSFERAIKKEGTKPYLLKLSLLAIGYIAFAKLGLSLAFSFDQITTIWPPTGIAIAAILLWGYYYWPGVFVGAFIINALSDASPAVAAGIAIGNTLEALVAVFLIKRYVGKNILDKISSVGGFVFFATFLSTMISASIGTAALVIGGNITTTESLRAWFTWWVGDMMGALLIVPLIVAWRTREYREQFTFRIYEATALLLLVIMVSLIIFSQPATSGQENISLTYLVFPLIILTAVRFTQIGAVTTGTVLTIAAVWSTIAGTGPYIKDGSPEKGLLVLHFFILVVMLTSLVLSVAVYGRLRSEQALAKKAKELERAHAEILKNTEWRKDLQDQMKEAQDRINNILLGIFESETPKKPPRVDK